MQSNGESNATSATPETATPTETGTNKTVSSDAATTEVKATTESKTATEQPKLDEPTKESISAKYAQLSKAENQLRRQKLDLEAKEKVFKSEQEKIQKQLQEFNEYKTKAKLNPIEGLKHLGLSLDDITQYLLNDKKPTPQTELDQLKKELHNLKTEREQEKQQAIKRAQEIEKQRQIQLYNSYVESIKKTVKSGPEYEYIDLMGDEGIQGVVKTVEETYNKTKKLLSEKEAALEVNASIIKDVDNFIKDERVKRRIQEVYGIKFDEPKESGSSAKSPKNTKTLTNSLVNDVGSAPAKVLSDEERLEKALSVIRYASN